MVAEGQEDADVSDDEIAAESEIKYLRAVKQSLHAMRDAKKWPEGCKTPLMHNRPSVKCSELKTKSARVRAVADILSVVTTHAMHCKYGDKPPSWAHPIADVSQCVTRAVWRIDGLIPTVCTSTQLYSFKLCKFICSKDVVVSMGYPDTVPFAIFSDTQQRVMAGNGYVVPLAACALCPFLVHTGHIIKM